MTEPELKLVLERCFIHLRLHYAGRDNNPRRWSASDLITDLAPVLLSQLGEKRAVVDLDYLIGVAQNTQGAEVWRALFAEMRRSVKT